MKLNDINKGGHKKTVEIFEVVGPQPNPPGTRDIHEQDNTATLRNADKAKEILNRLKK